MSRPISPELVLSPDFWNSNIPRYFCFAHYYDYYDSFLFIDVRVTVGQQENTSWTHWYFQGKQLYKHVLLNIFFIIFIFKRKKKISDPVLWQSSFTNGKLKKAKWHTKKCSITQRLHVNLRTVSRSNYSDATCVVNRFTGSTLQLPTTAVQSKGQTFQNLQMLLHIELRIKTKKSGDVINISTQKSKVIKIVDKYLLTFARVDYTPPNPSRRFICAFKSIFIFRTQLMLYRTLSKNVEPPLHIYRMTLQLYKKKIICYWTKANHIVPITFLYN